VVRTYLLPMFETDVKKHQRKARQKLQGNGAASLSPHRDENAAYNALPDSNTVYGELKLSDKLQLEIYTLREDKGRLQEQVESLGYKNSQLERALADLQLKLKQSAIKQRDFKDQLNKKTKDISSLQSAIKTYLQDK
jgi:chromosome segregation ATPase